MVEGMDDGETDTSSCFAVNAAERAEVAFQAGTEDMEVMVAMLY